MITPEIVKFPRNYLSALKTTHSKNAEEGIFLNYEIEATSILSVNIEMPESIVSSYKIPGQYCTISLDNDNFGFYTMRNPPDGRAVFTFFIKDNDILFNKVITESIIKLKVSEAQGKGFQIKPYFDTYKYDFPTTQVLMLATGRGMAPIAATLDAEILNLKSISYNSLFERRALLYIGAKSMDHLPCRKDFKRWEQTGVKIIPVLSQPSSDYKDRSGYVQDLLKQDTVRAPRNTGVLLSGHRYYHIIIFVFINIALYI